MHRPSSRMYSAKSGSVATLTMLALALGGCRGDAGSLTPGELERVTQALDTPGGTVDETFGSGGVTYSDPPCCDVSPVNEGLVQPDGKILLGGTDVHQNFALVRHNPDGSEDLPFGSGGGTTTNFTLAGEYSNDVILALGLQTGGKIVAIGFSQQTEQHYFAIARHDAQGNIDSTFGVDGKVLFALPGVPGNRLSPSDGLVQPDGKIVAFGYVTNPGNTTSELVTVRFTPDGAPDPTFGTGGVVVTPWPGVPYVLPSSIHRQPDGKLLALASFRHPEGQTTGYSFAVVRYNDHGTLDPSFGTGGFATLGHDSDVIRGEDLALQADGKIVIAGAFFVTDNNGFALGRMNANGSPDTSFGNGGIVTTSGNANWAQSVVVQTDGKIVAGGWGVLPSDEHSFVFALARYTTSGALDPTFGEAGRVNTAFQNSAQLRDLILLPDGKILATGSSSLPTPTGGNDSMGVIARYLPGNRILSTSFDQDSSGFVYRDDTFKGTSKPAHAAGAYLPSGGFSGGGLRVRLGNVDGTTVTNMSGGWQRTFNLPQASRVSISFRHNLVQPPNLEPDEYGQVMVSIDGDPRSWNGGEYIVRLNGVEGGEGGPDRSTGWHGVTLDLGNLAAGNHTLTFGGFANKKTAIDEYSDVLIDDVAIAVEAATGVELVFDSDFDKHGAEDYTYADDQFRGTNQPAYASGTHTNTGGYDPSGGTSGGIQVTVGNVNDTAISNMSGGWRKTITVGTPIKQGIVHFRFRHVQQPNYEPDEFTSVLVSVNGVLKEFSKITGNGEGGAVQDSGWVELAFATGPLGDGTHTFVFGAFNNHKSSVTESATVTFDDIRFSAQY